MFELGALNFAVQGVHLMLCLVVQSNHLLLQLCDGVHAVLLNVALLRHFLLQPQVLRLEVRDAFFHLRLQLA